MKIFLCFYCKQYLNLTLYSTPALSNIFAIISISMHLFVPLQIQKSPITTLV